ncbi:MAG: EAL domain-containing protein [Erythrobacter sp.]
MRRIRYVVVAAVLAVLVSLPNLLSPFDLVAWTMQANIGHDEPSGQIVFVEVPDTVIDDERGLQSLGRSLERLERSGAKATFLDLTRSQSSKDSARNLADIFDQSPATSLVIRRAKDEKLRHAQLPLEDLPPSRIVVADHGSDFMGYVWRVPESISVGGRDYPSFSSALAGKEPDPDAWTEIDYHFQASDIPSVALEDLADGDVSADFIAGRSFVFGYAAPLNGSPTTLPGSGAAPTSYIAIFAAETIGRGGMFRAGPLLFDYVVPLLACILLLAGAAFLSDRYRRLLYLAAVSVCFAILIVPIFVSIRIGVAPSIFFLFVYGIQAMIFRWRARINLNSAETGLPSLKRLERDLVELPPSARVVVVAAKIHNFAEVMATLSGDARIDYFAGLVKRLRVGDTSLTVYSNSSDKLFWLQDFETQETLRSHLTALRAIFKNPLRVNGKPIDISATFGVDLNFPGEAHRRIGQAEALTARTSLSAQPILFGDEPDDAEGEWRISLQSKIDTALENKEIFPVFQPQVDIHTLQTVGYEGLVRWKDRERGFIDPSYFIEQCEQAGRMERLQHFMLNTCISRFSKASVIDTDNWLAINVSATLLSDSWLPELVDQVLGDTGFPAQRLVLEITETARIPDHLTASAILQSLASLGVHLSLDDFGTGSAGLENFLRLPFSEIKIDRAFTTALKTNAKARAIMANSLKLGEETGVRVIVEGVEDEQTLAILRDLGCRYAQGYLFGRPLFDLKGFDNREFYPQQTG